MGWSVVMMEKPVTTPPQFWPFPSVGIPQTFQNFNVVGLFHSWWTTPLASKKTVSSTLILDQTWLAFFGSGGCFARSL